MSALGIVQQPVSVVSPWPMAALEMLDEQHLCLWSESAPRRARVVRQLAEHLCHLQDAEVCVLDGGQIASLDDFCLALETALGLDRIDRDVATNAGVFGALRGRGGGNELSSKRRFIIWNDAHVLLKADPRLFGQLVDAIIGTSSESELLGDDLLLLQRAVFVGRASLDLYSEDQRGQFRSWFSEQGEEPLWRLVTGVERPPIESLAVERVAHEL